MFRISPFGQEVHPTAASKHPVTERSEVAVLTSVRGPRNRKWAGEGLLETSGSESWRLRREAVGGSAREERFFTATVQKCDEPGHPISNRPGRPALYHSVAWWFDAGIPGHVLFSSMYCRI